MLQLFLALMISFTLVYIYIYILRIILKHGVKEIAFVLVGRFYFYF